MKENIRLCPKCGNTAIHFPQPNTFHCKNCDFILFQNVAASVAVILVYRDTFLAVRRNQDPGKGKWDLPGGFADPFEGITETCAREIKEELGYGLNPNELSFIAGLPNRYPYKDGTYNTMDMFFMTRVGSPRIPLMEQSEIQSSCWISIQEARSLEWAFASMQNFFANGTNIAILQEKMEL